jgi:RNA polymerase sigma-70 factor (ECF subfamily)
MQRYCRDGDKEAFSRFYRSQSDRLWRFLRARGVDGETAYDLMAEAFLRFIQVACKDVSAPVALLYRIAINLHIDLYRRARCVPLEGEGADMMPQNVTGHPQDERIHMLRLLKTLSTDEQNLLLLRYWIGMTHKEVAQVLQVPEGTIRRQCAATLKKLAVQWVPVEQDQREEEPVH